MRDTVFGKLTNYVLVCLEEIHGNYLYLTYSTHRLAKKSYEEADSLAAQLASNRFSMKGEEIRLGKYRYASGMLTRVIYCKFITKKEFDVLNKYL